MSGTNRPFKYGPMDRREFITSNGEVAILCENDGSGNAVYIAKAKAGTASSEAKWQISKQTYDGNNALLTKKWPQNSDGKASTEFEFVYDDRATYTYS